MKKPKKFAKSQKECCDFLVVSDSWFHLRLDGKHIRSAGMRSVGLWEGGSPHGHRRESQQVSSLLRLANLGGGGEGTRSLKSRQRGSNRDVVTDILEEACSCRPRGGAGAGGPRSPGGDRAVVWPGVLLSCGERRAHVNRWILLSMALGERLTFTHVLSY